MSRPKRLAGFSYIGLHRYLLTFRTLNGARMFERADVVHDALMQIRLTATLDRFAILAYCFMPDHLHLLVDALNDEAKLKPFVKMAKQRSGASHALCGSGRLWHEGFWDNVLRIDDDPMPSIRYILENPVRARLVHSPRDYPHLGSDVWPLEYLLDLL
jgi:putative transposase